MALIPLPPCILGRNEVNGNLIIFPVKWWISDTNTERLICEPTITGTIVHVSLLSIRKLLTITFELPYSVLF